MVRASRRRTNVLADAHLGKQSDDIDSYPVANERVERVVNVARIARRERTKDDDDFSGRVSGQVTEACPCELECVLQRRLTSAFEFALVVESFEMVCRVATERRQFLGASFSRRNDGELRYRVLIKEFGNEFLQSNVSSVALREGESRHALA